MVVWYLLSINTTTARAFQNQVVVLGSIKTMIDRGVFWNDISSSLISVTAGFALGFALSLPSAILMAWYAPVRNIVEPWIQFIRNIPPLAYVPLIVMVAGVGRKPQIIVITIATFLIMTVTIYQGVINVDETLIKAARVLGETDKDIFLKVIAPATLPFIITAIRLGSSTALTTLIAAESTGAQAGLGMIEAACESQKYAIGVDADQAMALADSQPEQSIVIVTSVMKNIDQVLLLSVKRHIAGELPYGTVEALGMEENAVGLAINDIYDGIATDDMKAKVEELQGKIQSGEIKVNSAFTMTDDEIKAVKDSVAP